MQTFLPSVMISCGSVLSVFVSPRLVPGRMGLCITAFLAMISLFNGARWVGRGEKSGINFRLDFRQASSVAVKKVLCYQQGGGRA